MKIKIYRDPYDIGITFTRPKEIELTEGLTILVGCNGAGKSTLINNINSECKKNNIPVYKFDNLQNGGNHSISSAMFNNNFRLSATLMTSSEGEALKLNIGTVFSLTKGFLKNGYVDDKEHRFERLFSEEKEITTNIRVLLFDAADSGMSIDAVNEILKVYNLILEDSKQQGLETYIIVSANEYELCRNNDCFDVNNGKYIKFKDYEDYRQFILKNREKKDKRKYKKLA